MFGQKQIAPGTSDKIQKKLFLKSLIFEDHPIKPSLKSREYLLKGDFPLTVNRNILSSVLPVSLYL